MAYRQIIIFLITALVLTSCGPGRKTTSRSVILDTVNVSVNPRATSTYRETSPKTWDIMHTSVDLSFNWKEKTANGKARLTMQPYFYSTDSIELDAKSMQIDTVMMNGRAVQFSYKDDKLKLKLNRLYNKDEKIELFIAYKAMPYAKAAGGSAAISSDRGLYFINTDYAVPRKPAQIWTQGETESNSHWLPTIDKPNERFTFELSLTVPDSFTTLSNGALASQNVVGNGMRRDVWRIDQPVQTYALMLAVGKFSVVEEQWREKEVSYYVEPPYAPYATRMFAYTPEMMEHYSNITGVPYPWNKYSQVVVRDYVSGAMENTSATLLGEFTNKNSRELLDADNEGVVSHELFHQWFGDYVTAESWSHLTLNESFANYGEYLWEKYKYGKLRANVTAYRQLRSYVNNQSKEYDPPLVRYYYSDPDAVFDLISYQKGGAILHYLHELIGDAAFYRAMNIYLTKNALQSAEATQWRLAVEEATGQDWNWFFNQWYYRGGRPTLDAKYEYDDNTQKLVVTVTQTQKELYKLPVKAWIVYGDMKTEIDLNIARKMETFSYPYKNGQKPIVLIDADHVVVGEVNYNFKSWQWLTVYKNSDSNIVNKLLAINEARKRTDEKESEQIIDLALKDKNATVKEMMLGNLLLVKDSKWREKWKPDVLYLAKKGDNHKVRAAAFDVLNQWKIKAPQEDILTALADSSYRLAGSALRALNEVNKDTAYLLSKKLLENNPKGNLESEIWQHIADRGNDADIQLFESRAAYIYGSQKINFAASLSDYLKNVADTTAFRKGVNIFVMLANGESIKSYRSSIASYLFQSAITYKERAGAGRNKAERDAQQKLTVIKTAVDEIIAAEKDESNLKSYRNYRKKIWG
jgi:aminopeptidase N